MYFFYVLKSLKDGRYYKGYSSDLTKRIERHNAGGVKSTKYRRPLELIYYESFTIEKQARDREKWSKTFDGGMELKKIIQNFSSSSYNLREPLKRLGYRKQCFSYKHIQNLKLL